MEVAQIVTLVVSAVAYLLVALCTKASLASVWKVIIVAVVALAIGLIEQAVTGWNYTQWEWWLALLGFAWVFFWGIMKSTGLYEWLQSKGIHD